MPTRRGLLATGVMLAFGGCLGDGSTSDDDGDDGAGNDDAGDGGSGGDDGADSDDAGGNDDTGDDPELAISSPAFEAGASIPTRYTCDGEDVSPPLRLRGTTDAASLAVIVDDPDAPTDEPFVHWTLWNLPPDTEELPEALPRDLTVSQLDGAAQGTNELGDVGYRGPCPPADDGPHTYRFTVLRLDASLDLDPAVDAETFRAAVEPHVRGEATLTGTYERE